MKKIRGIYIIRVSALLLIFMLSGFILINICSAQKKEESKPEVKIDVNKKYDEKERPKLRKRKILTSHAAQRQKLNRRIRQIHLKKDMSSIQKKRKMKHGLQQATKKRK